MSDFKRKTLPRICKTCGKPFDARLDAVKNGGGKFCCRICWRNRPLDVEAFWRKVVKTESCWLWIGSKDHSYGVVSIHSRHRMAHRISWELANGPIPEGLDVCHNCPGGDNPVCVNPNHMFLGTQADNMRDAAAKGRLFKKLSREQISEIRANRAKNSFITAKEYGVSASRIRAIRNMRVLADSH